VTFTGWEGTQAHSIEPPGLARTGAKLIAGLALTGCSAQVGPEWIDLARSEVSAVPPAGQVDGGARVVAEGDERWLVVAVERAAWKSEAEAGRFAAELPVLAVGRPRAGGAPYRLRAGERAFVYEPDGELLGRERGRFAITATRGLKLLLALEPGEDPPERAEFAAVLDFQRRDDGALRVGGRRLSGEGLWVTSGGTRALSVRIPPDARLSFATAVEPLFGAKELRTAAHTFRVWLDGALLFEHRASPDLVGEAIQWHAVDLPRGGVQRARLEFGVEGPLALTSILAPRVGPRDFGSYAARPFEATRERPDLLVFLADTFRADNLAAYGGPSALTPEIDRLANESRLFAHAWSTGTHTLAAHSSMFSGCYPRQNGQVDFYNPLPSQVETLAERLAAHGYRCAAVTDGVMVSQSHGLAQGFESFDERRESGTLERVRSVLDADDGRPLFLFVQTYAAHTPYAMSAATRARWEGELALDKSYEELMASEVMRSYEALPLGGEMPRDDPAVSALASRLRDLYRAGAAEVDALFGRFRAELEARALFGTGVLLFASDHGEAFFEHGRAFHANRVFEEELRIPLILHGPGIAPGREERFVSLIDFAPTLASLAGAAVPAHWRGHSLLAPPAERPLYAFQSHRVQDKSTLAVIDGARKLIGYETLEAVRAGKLHAAFDLGVDPLERESLAERERWPAELLRAHQRELEELLTPLVTQEVLELGGEELEELRKFGYGGAERDE